MDLHSIHNEHFNTFFTYVKRLRFSVRKRPKTDTQILHVLYVHTTVSIISVHFVCKYQNESEQQNSFRCSM